MLLELFTPGRATFVVQSDAPLSGLVFFALGYDPQQLQQFFIGYVESSITMDAKQQKLFCRELTATINRALPLSLRHVTLNDTLVTIAEDSGLEFVTPDQDYVRRRAPYFYSLGGGYHCMDSLAGVYQIEQMIWQQQTDGKVWVGDWKHSPWAEKQPLDLDPEWMTAHSAAETAKTPVLPRLRPGVALQDLGYVDKVRLAGSHMTISWSKNPWKDR